MSCNCNNYTQPKTPCGDCANKCHEVVDTYSEVSYYHNAFVTVRDENATYHVDNTGNPIAVSRNPIYSNTYTPTTGDYKQTVVYNFDANEGYLFDPAGNYRIIPLIEIAGGSSS